MGVKVSIIIPSYNRYPQNLLSLYSLKNQTFNPSKMEVILIDDCSSDKTSHIPMEFHPPFNFKYIRCNKNMGRSKARNIGIETANGEIIIFLDAEMIVNQDFVQKHYDYHQTHKNGVLTGALGYYSLYSFIFPDFNQSELNQISELIKNDPVFLNRYKTFIKTKRLTQMIFREDIDSLRFQKLSYFSQIPIDQKTIARFGEDLTGFQIPWIAFLTGNVSLRKELLENAGFFDEGFEGWGFEDWELGYRLYKCGATFAYHQNVANYHQEHPITDNKNLVDCHKNYKYFQIKHPEIDILLLGLLLMGYYDRLDIHETLEEYKRLEKDYPNQFSHFKNSILLLLKETARQLCSGKPVKNIKTKSGLQRNNMKNYILSERNVIKSQGTFKKLVYTFDLLSSL